MRVEASYTVVVYFRTGTGNHEPPFSRGAPAVPEVCEAVKSQEKKKKKNYPLLQRLKIAQSVQAVGQRGPTNLRLLCLTLLNCAVVHFFFTKKIYIMRRKRARDSESDPPRDPGPASTNPPVELLMRELLGGKSKVLCVIGAGVSTSAGLCDFRFEKDFLLNLRTGRRSRNESSPSGT